MMRVLGLLLVLAAMPAAGRAQGYSYTTWSIAGPDVTLLVTLPAAAARVLAGNFIPAETNAALSRYVADHVDVHAGEDACPPIDQGQDVGLIDTLAPLPGVYRYQIMFRCPHAGALRLDSHLLFAQVPDHLDFALVQLPEARTVTRVLDAAHQSIIIPPDRAPAGASLAAYVALGGAQMVRQTARIAFVLALLLGLRRREDWITAWIGLACGYALSIGLAAGGVAAARPEVAETTIGLLTVLLAARAATTRDGSATAATLALAGVVVLLGVAEALASRGDQAMLLLGDAMLVPCVLLVRAGPARALPWLIPTVLFGVLDGARFSAAVVAIGLPGRGVLLPLAGRHLGALMGIGLLSAAAMACVWLARRRHWPFGRALLADCAASGLAGFGMFWFVARLHA
jgi:hypothetical protein